MDPRHFARQVKAPPSGLQARGISHQIDLLRAPFSLQKITWNPDTKTVIYRSRRNSRTKRNFEVFKATDFLGAAIEPIHPCATTIKNDP